jgi:hypothetical protein
MAVWRPIILAGLALTIWLVDSAGSQDLMPDTADVFYQEYLNRLVEDLRLSQIQDLAKNWGIVVGGRQFRMNRSFWEQRLSLNLSLGAFSGSDFQSAVIEYQLWPRLTVRGEVARRTARSEAWLDFIFHIEY